MNGNYNVISIGYNVGCDVGMLRDIVGSLWFIYLYLWGKATHKFGGTSCIIESICYLGGVTLLIWWWEQVSQTTTLKSP